MPPTDAWSGLDVGTRLAGGARSEVWEADLRGERVVLRRSRRTAASLTWELELMTELSAAGFVVPETRPTDDGRPSVDGMVAQSWVEGRAPTSPDD